MNPKRIKIGLAGTHSTGKTSLLNAIDRHCADRGLKVVRVGNIASEAKARGFPILHAHTFASTLWILSRGISLELEAERSADIILVDRPAPDALAYLIAALKAQGRDLASFEREYLEALVGLHSKTFTALFKTTLDLTEPIGSEKPRDLDPRFRISVDDALAETFVRLGIPFEVLAPECEVAERQILRNVERLITGNAVGGKAKAF